MSDTQGPINPKTAFESHDAPPAVLAGVMGLVAAVTISVGLILSGIFPGTLSERSAAPPRLPPSPRPQINEAEALIRFDARVEKRLQSYGWVDRKNGVVHVPITVAMQRAAKTGFPHWPGNPEEKTRPQAGEVEASRRSAVQIGQWLGGYEGVGDWALRSIAEAAKRAGVEGR
ncbi:MAG TPA: hypothetical protein VJ770_13585 [Stellaceae bacterium]|nr:hypothetical protein [Stellaceae bacterium]